MAADLPQTPAPPLGPNYAMFSVKSTTVSTAQQRLQKHHSDELYTDGVWVKTSLPQDHHITVCNQIAYPVPEEAIRALLPAHASGTTPCPYRLTISGFEVFEQKWANCAGRPDAAYDVIVAKLAENDVYKQLHTDLHALNQSQPHYPFNPHLTVGYVKSGCGKAIIQEWGDIMLFTEYPSFLVIKQYRTAEVPHPAELLRIECCY